ncbi:MAG: hypothetical protein FD123_1816 [Bacteroidetes bacterium]|nr:MAG: hypothetical protein FD123_1816 [Bacteroidota bacterium]
MMRNKNHTHALPAFFLKTGLLLAIMSCQTPGEKKTTRDTMNEQRTPDTTHTHTDSIKQQVPAGHWKSQAFLDTIWNGKPLKIEWMNFPEGQTDSFCVIYDKNKKISLAVPEVDDVSGYDQRGMLIYKNGKLKPGSFVSVSHDIFLVSTMTMGMKRPEIRGFRVANDRLEIFKEDGAKQAYATVSGQVNYVFVNTADKLLLLHSSNNSKENAAGIESSRTIYIYRVENNSLVRLIEKEFSIKEEETPAYHRLFQEKDMDAYITFYLLAYKKYGSSKN